MQTGSNPSEVMACLLSTQNYAVSRVVCVHGTHIILEMSNVRRAEEQVRHLEDRFDRSQLVENLIELNKWQAMYIKDMSEQEDFWRQKARSRWLVVGDNNTKYFHASVASKRLRLAIHRIKNEEGVWLDDVSQIKSQAVHFFEKFLLAEQGPVHEGAVCCFLDFIPSLVSRSDNVDLLRPLTLDEVRAAVFALNPESISGPDGFPGSFYQACWQIISLNLLLAV